MLLIADSGSTKADWKAIYSKDKVESYRTMGFNPNYHKEETIIAALKKDLAIHIAVRDVKQIVFYGSGCWDAPRKGRIETALKAVIPNANIQVEHDLLASARATCGKEAGIACILGTGSNSILFDGEKEIDNVTNLGYLLGDEGSGTHLGKYIIRSYFYRELPIELSKKFEKVCPGGKQEILDNVYGESVPALYLSSFSKFLAENKEHPFIEKLIKSSFLEFFSRHVFKYENYQNLPIHFVGSVAFHYQDILRKMLKEMNLKFGMVIKEPIDNLTKFHLNGNA